MAAPSSYTEDELKAFLHGELGSVADTLGWSVADGDYDEIVNEALIAYDVDDIADADDIAKLRALGRVAAWKAAMYDLAARYDFEADGGQYKRSQLHDMAQRNLMMAEDDALRYVDWYTVTHTAVTYDDPYAYDDEDEV
jgi:hypothetical protein